MRFTVTNIEHSSERDSDYETAAELSHSVINTTVFQLTHETGVQLEITAQEISTTTSYLEPDFDDEDHKPGDPIRYESQPSEEPAKSQKSCSLGVYTAKAYSALTDEDWVLLDQLRRYEAGTLGTEFEGFEDGEQAIRIYDQADLESIGYDTAPLNKAEHTSLPEDFADALMDYRQGEEVELELPEWKAFMVEQQIEKHQQQQKSNAQIELGNRLGQHIWQAKQAINEHVQEIKRGLRAPRM